MNLIVRLVRVALAALRRSRIGPLDPSELRFRVWPNDLDVNLHMNNARYLAIMDLGRVDLLARLGLGRVVLRERWQPLVGSVTIRYRRSLAPFERYLLTTRALCWDDKWFFIEQRFTRGGELVAVALVKGLLRGPGGNVPPSSVLAALGRGAESPPAPPAVSLWQDAERLVDVA